MAELASLRFSDLKPGMKAKIVSCDECTAELTRLQELGLTAGAEIEVIRVAPLGDPVELNVRGYRLCLRKKENCAFKLQSTNE